VAAVTTVSVSRPVGSTHTRMTRLKRNEVRNFAYLPAASIFSLVGGVVIRDAAYGLDRVQSDWLFLLEGTCGS
jgi:hypothetical protein